MSSTTALRPGVALGPYPQREDLRDNWDTVTDQTGYGTPSNLAEETAMFLPFFK